MDIPSILPNSMAISYEILLRLICVIPVVLAWMIMIQKMIILYDGDERKRRNLFLQTPHAIPTFLIRQMNLTINFLYQFIIKGWNTCKRYRLFLANLKQGYLLVYLWFLPITWKKHWSKYKGFLTTLCINPQSPLLDSWKNLAPLNPSSISRLRMQ